MRIFVSGTVALVMGLAGSAYALGQDLAAQLDTIAAAVNAENADELGGPSDVSGIIANLDGQWILLNNLVRNWGSSGVGMGAEDLARSFARNCSGDANDATFYEVTGENSFSVRETLGAYNTEFTQVLTHVEGRSFGISFDDDALIRSYGKENASEDEKAEIRAMADQLRQQTLEFWRPSEDILVTRSSFGFDVTGRCPLE